MDMTVGHHRTQEIRHLYLHSDLVVHSVLELTIAMGNP